MRATTCLTLLAAGAIAAFAVHLPTFPVNMQVAGLILMATGIAGFFVPARPSEWVASKWMRRRILVHGDLNGDLNGDLHGDLNGDLHGDLNGDLNGGDPAGQDGLDDDDERYPSYLWQDPAVLAAQVLDDIEAAAAARRAAGRPRPQPGGRRPDLRLAGPGPAEVAPASRRLTSVKPPEEDRQAGTG